MTRAKPTNTSGKKTIVTKKVEPVKGEYVYNTKTGSQHWTTPDTRRRIAKELVEYIADNSKCYTLCEYFDTQAGITQKQYNHWMQNEDDEELKAYLVEQYDIAKRMLGRKLNGIAIERNLGMNSAAMFTVPALLREHKEQMEYRASLANKVDENGNKEFIVMRVMPNSPMVPDKKDE